MKVLTKRPPRYSTNKLHLDLNILQIKDIYESSLLHFTHNCIYGKPIENFKNFFTFRQNIHDHNTRQKRHLTTHTINTEMGRTTTHFMGATLWNALPETITEVNTIKAFKRQLFKFLISKYSD